MIPQHKSKFAELLVAKWGFRKDLAGALTIFQHLFTLHSGLGPPMPNRLFAAALLV